MRRPASPSLVRRIACCSLPLAMVSQPGLSGQLPPPPLMLANTYAADVDLQRYLVSEKLDGVRGYWTGSRLLTRAGHIIHAPGWFTAGWPDTPLDGELWIGRGRFDEVSAIVRSGAASQERWRQVRFMVFDLPQASGAFAARYARLQHLLGELSVPWVQAVVQCPMNGASELESALERIVAAGGEGLMLRRSDAPYRAVRSDDLLKVKTHDDAEARVVATFPGQGRLNGLMGSLLVECPDGRRFRLGSGFTDAQRRDPPPPGSWVTYRYNGLTADGLPRFARFLRMRDELPPADPDSRGS